MSVPEEGVTEYKIEAVSLDDLNLHVNLLPLLTLLNQAMQRF